MSNWVNVMDFGAKGDGQTDDSAAIDRAIMAAESPATVVYFPKSGGFAYDGKLPSLVHGTRVTLYLDSQLDLLNTLQVSSGYVIHGNSSGALDAFSTDKLASINVGPNASPAISIHGQSGIRLENLQIEYVNYGSDGIVVDGASAEIVLNNVFTSLHGDATSGVPLLIRGGFGYTIEGGGYVSASSGPAIQFTDDAACNYAGILRIRHTFLGGHGIGLNSSCGGLNSMTFEDILLESASTAFLSIESTSPVGIWSISIKDVNMADSVGSSKPPLIDVHCQCAGVWGVQVFNSNTDGVQLTTGDPISDLEVWSPNPHAGYKIAQLSGYVLHTPFGIYNAMPTYQVGKTADFSISAASQSTQTVQSGQTGDYQLSVTASPGFQQPLSFTCTGAPAGASCEVSPSSLSLNGPASSTVSAVVSTTARSNIVDLPPGMGLSLSSAFCSLYLLAIVALSVLNRRRNTGERSPVLATATALTLLSVLAMSLTSCAGVVAGTRGPGVSGGPSNSNPVGGGGTSAGSYALTVTGTCASCSPAMTRSATITLVVK